MCRGPASNQLPVHYYKYGIPGAPPNTSSIGLCVKPIHFSYNKTLQLLQFLEINRILGVQRRVVTITPHSQSQGLGVTITPHSQSQG